MIARDERWEKVEASVAPYIWPNEDVHIVPEHPVTEFLIEVRDDETVWYCRILAADVDLELYPELYGVTLDEMVKNIDDRLRGESN